MVEYYKTQKGYCYKKTQKGGSKRISNKDYEKKTKLKGAGSDPVPPNITTSLQNNNTKKSPQSPSPLTTTPAQQQDEVNYFIVNDIKFNLDSDYDEITEEINEYITKYKINIKIGQGGGKQNKRKKKKQKGGVYLKEIKLESLLKKLKCFGNTDGSQNAIQQNEQQQSAIQDIKNVYNHMDKQIRELQNNVTLPSNAFEKLSKDIRTIPDFNSSDMIKLIESEYIKHNCNINKQQQNNTNKQQQSNNNKQRQNKNATSNLLNNNSDVIKLVIAFCVLILNKLDFIPEYKFGNREVNQITAFGYVVYLLALLFLKILKEISPIEIKFTTGNNNNQ
tara:strand:- start:147 stop:1148 length:1002 start_codon:yes stop_codon:yes gene_type:complete